MKKMVLALGAVIWFSGCGVFEPRQSEPPSNFNARSYATYNEVLSQVYDVYFYRNPAGISDVLPPEDTLFTFEADNLDSISMPVTTPRIWHRADEIRITSTILNDSLAGLLYNELLSGGTVDSAVVKWSYSITRRDSAHIKGTSEFTIKRYLNRFYLVSWKDHADSTGPGVISWGRWKMENY